MASENDGNPLGKARFYAETGIRESDWSGRYWARWGDAIREAGFEPNKLQGRLDHEEAIRLLAHETRRLGHFPTFAELRLARRNDPLFPSDGVYQRLGPKGVLAGRVAEFCRENSDFPDVLDIVAPLAHPDKRDPSDGPTSARVEEGFVYLLRSGRHYKLGHTNSIGRREYELAIQLPERATKVHVIRTDDPSGIEGLLASAFCRRRGNGEWFELTQANVKAFKRRKFV